MKKYLFVILPLLFILTGCGHKSKTKLVDIEQFKCQDSIQTVFDVLGETDIESHALEGEICKYEGLNLWGYNGEAVFHIRDNQDTIQSFYCTLILNKKEFEDVLCQLSDKYGNYEKAEYTNQITYTWEVPEDEAERLGYCKISLSNHGNQRTIIEFSDEWSLYTDEAYYEHLEEEERANVLASRTYNVGEDTFSFSLEQNGDGDYSFVLLCQIADKADAFSVHVLLNAIMNSDDHSIESFFDAMDFSYFIFSGDGTTIMRTKNILYVTSSSGEMIDIVDYFSPEWISSEEYHGSDYGTQVTDFMVDFIKNE